MAEATNHQQVAADSGSHRPAGNPATQPASNPTRQQPNPATQPASKPTRQQTNPPANQPASQPLKSATPSKTTQALAFAGIVVAGVCGGLAGYAFGDLQCEQGCHLEAALWGLGGALLAAIGVGVVATLTLRATHEWHDQPISQKNQKK